MSARRDDSWFYIALAIIVILWGLTMWWRDANRERYYPEPMPRMNDEKVDGA